MKETKAVKTVMYAGTTDVWLNQAHSNQNKPKIYNMDSNTLQFFFNDLAQDLQYFDIFHSLEIIGKSLRISRMPTFLL